MNIIRCQRGETTLGSVMYALLFCLGLMFVVQVTLFLFVNLQFYHAKTKADRAMAIYGGYTSEVTTIIENNLAKYVDLSDVIVTATPYPVNRGETYSLELAYNYPLGLVTFTGSNMGWGVIDIPIRSYSYGASEKVIR